CSGKHHKSLCDKHTTTHVHTVVQPVQSAARLYTAAVILSNPQAHNATKAHVLLDHGSQISLVSPDPLSRSDLKIIQEKIKSIPPHFTENKVVNTDLLIGVGDSLALLDNSKETKLPCGYRLLESSIGPLVVGSYSPRISMSTPDLSIVSAVVVAEMTTEHPPTFMSELAVVAKPVVETVIDLTRFSSLKMAISETARVYRFLSKLASRVKNREIQEKLAHIPINNNPLLNASEKKFALQRIIYLHQIKHVGVGKPNHSIITEDSGTGIWVASTRLTNSDLSPESKSPVYIPTSADSTLAPLLIHDVHKSATHANIQTILNHIKSKYWIPRCHQIAKSVLKQCLHCRRTNGLPFKYAISPALPPDCV
ncbi:hypothetical protein PFISCL1PPCAC_5320, partial [Pristionchus fissidentatus]